jgi:hypothetical protein
VTRRDPPAGPTLHVRRLHTRCAQRIHVHGLPPCRHVSRNDWRESAADAPASGLSRLDCEREAAISAAPKRLRPSSVSRAVSPPKCPFEPVSVTDLVTGGTARGPLLRRKGPLTCTFLVAGAGFEPATSGYEHPNRRLTPLPGLLLPAYRRSPANRQLASRRLATSWSRVWSRFQPDCSAPPPRCRS